MDYKFLPGREEDAKVFLDALARKSNCSVDEAYELAQRNYVALARSLNTDILEEFKVNSGIMPEDYTIEEIYGDVVKKASDNSEVIRFVNKLLDTYKVLPSEELRDELYLKYARSGRSVPELVDLKERFVKLISQYPEHNIDPNPGEEVMNKIYEFFLIYSMVYREEKGKLELCKDLSESNISNMANVMVRLYKTFKKDMPSWVSDGVYGILGKYCMMDEIKRFEESVPNLPSENVKDEIYLSFAGNQRKRPERRLDDLRALYSIFGDFSEEALEKMSHIFEDENFSEEFGRFLEDIGMKKNNFKDLSPQVMKALEMMKI